MQTCLTPLGLLALAVFLMATGVRWFEQTAEAVDRKWWNKVMVLVVVPFAVWFYPSRVSAGRPTGVPRHEPVRGFGKVSLSERGNGSAVKANTPPPPMPSDGPPPGTPAEFLGMPVIPPRKKAPKAGVDPEKIEALKRKMREQGMLPDDGDAQQRG
jgi:hypothetical protein